MTTAKVLTTNKLVTENGLATLTITHSMHDAIAYVPLILIHERRVVVGVSSEKKKKLPIEPLLGLFEAASGTPFSDDKVMLSRKA